MNAVCLNHAVTKISLLFNMNSPEQRLSYLARLTSTGGAFPSFKKEKN
jgi:predicted SprT family Zn-dependent metalloprotease